MKDEWLKGRLDKHDDKFDEINQALSEINNTLAINTESLKHHVKRTDLLENQVNNLPSKVLIFISIIGGLITVFSKLF